MTAPQEAAKEATSAHAWHAHVYYTPETRAQAEQLRNWVGERHPAARLGRWHDAKVGPHPQSMYQIAFGTEDFPTLAPFLALNRQGLTILLHPETGRPKDDHLLHALWMGAVLPLDATNLPETE